MATIAAPSTYLAPWNENLCWGDAIQGAKFLPYLAPHCPGTTLVVRRELVRLFSLLGFPVASFDDAPEARGGGGGICAPTGVRLPQPDDMALPYLWADDLVQFNPDTNLFQVGLCWHGSGGGRSAPGIEDDWRCIHAPHTRLRPLLDVPGAQFTALHFFDHGRSVPDLPNLSDFGVWDFAGTAGIMKRLDLVITIDTSVAHLAGNLGVPTWLLLVSPKHPGFDGGRWACVPSSYPTVRQFRQDTPGDWEPVIAQVESELRATCATVVVK